MIELPTPLDLPEATEAIVKVQWPFQRQGASVMVYAKGLRHIRLVHDAQLPDWLRVQFDPGQIIYTWAVVRAGEWNFVMPAPPQDW